LPPLRPIVLLLLVVLAAGLAACGQEEHEGESAQVAETEGIYLEVGEMKYQVQISRQLNPLLDDDEAYFDGISEEELDLSRDQVWFGVWIRLENESDETIPAARNFRVVDTQENEYLPVPIEDTNPFAYQPAEVEGGELYPLPNSAAGERAPNGALLLFKLERGALDNRPLELVVEDPEGGPGAIVDLDV
jgi:hypothetical protein